MGFRISGEYAMTCECQQICPCSIDGTPTGRNNTCTGAGVFHVAKGNFDGIDLSGIDVAMMFYAPSNFSAGNLKLGFIIDSKANDEQAKCLEQIFTGQVGGPFAEFVPLIGEILGVEKGKVTFKAGAKPSATIGSDTITVEPALNADGKPTQIVNAMMAFRAEGYTIGKGTGKVKALGREYTSNYGETAAFEFAS